MQIRSEHIAKKEVVGYFKGNPVIYLKTYGGLNAFFINNGGHIEAAGAAPHAGIALFQSEKRFPEIKWDRSALLGI